ncbi:unnamed protein product [Rotaria sordida]|uniref:Acid ceramidase n=1 Tax=Rotaria sordida TaxID=392033 RepID=A0A814UH88_9BILA|nr:unnamed protein product [Rotaria sordida]
MYNGIDVLHTYVVNLDNPPMERWNQVVTAFKSEIIDILTFFKAYIIEISPNLKFLLDLVDDKLPAMVDTLPAPYGDEMKGISQATGLPLGIHIWDMSNNTWILTEKLRTLITQINFTRNGEVLFKTTSFAGYIGVLTGLKPNVFSISVNSRTSFHGGYEGLIEWIFNINRNQSFITFAIRDILTKAKSFDVVVNYLSETELLAPCYYIVGGPNLEQGVVITRDRTKVVNITRMGKDNLWFVIETNYDNWKKQPFFDDRLTPCIKCMKIKGQDHVTFESLFNVLSSRPMLNALTIYSTLMELSTGRYETYWQRCRNEDAP